MSRATQAVVLAVLAVLMVGGTAQAKNEDETYTFQFINLTTAEKLQKICELPGWELKMDEEATRKLAAINAAYDVIARERGL